MASSPYKIQEILKEHMIDLDGEHIPDLVSALDDYNDECADEAYQAGETEAKRGEDELRTEIEGDLRNEILGDLKTYLELAKSDPSSAAVYFHRATGKHLFEVAPCLL